jgi:hypothetical protein
MSVSGELQIYPIGCSLSQLERLVIHQYPAAYKREHGNDKDQNIKRSEGGVSLKGLPASYKNVIVDQSVGCEEYPEEDDKI